MKNCLKKFKKTKPNKPLASCNFCSKPQTEVAYLFHAHTKEVAICNVCVVTSHNNLMSRAPMVGLPANCEFKDKDKHLQLAYNFAEKTFTWVNPAKRSKLNDRHDTPSSKERDNPDTNTESETGNDSAESTET